MKTRKRSIILSICTLILLTGISCGSNKQTGRKALEENKCEQMALDLSSGKLRAYGVATSQNKSFARDNAILSARRWQQRAIAACAPLSLAAVVPPASCVLPHRLSGVDAKDKKRSIQGDAPAEGDARHRSCAAGAVWT